MPGPSSVTVSTTAGARAPSSPPSRETAIRTSPSGGEKSTAFSHQVRDHLREPARGHAHRRARPPSTWRRTARVGPGEAHGLGDVPAASRSVDRLLRLRGGARVEQRHLAHPARSGAPCAGCPRWPIRAGAPARRALPRTGPARRPSGSTREGCAARAPRRRRSSRAGRRGARGRGRSHRGCATGRPPRRAAATARSGPPVGRARRARTGPGRAGAGWAGRDGGRGEKAECRGRRDRTEEEHEHVQAQVVEVDEDAVRRLRGEHRTRDDAAVRTPGWRCRA